MNQLIFKLWRHLCQDTHTHTRTDARTNGRRHHFAALPLTLLPLNRDKHTPTELSSFKAHVLSKCSAAFYSAADEWVFSELRSLLGAVRKNIAISAAVMRTWESPVGSDSGEVAGRWSRGRGPLATDPGSRRWIPGLWKFRLSHQSELCITFNEVG